MGIEICTVGGYSEVCKSMLAVKIDEEVIILDMGLDLDPYIQHTDREDVPDMSPKMLTKIGAIPDIAIIKDWQTQVVAIATTHAHLDHIGAIPFLSNNFEAPILCTPFTDAVLRKICENEKIRLKNEIKLLNVNSKHKISDTLTVEFINMCHSTPQAVTIVLHTKYGKIVYATDFKFDTQPCLGKSCNVKRLKEVGDDDDVRCLIVTALKAGTDNKTPSESVAKELLKNVLLGTDSEGKAIIVTTFSSHLARLKSIIEIGKKLGRKIIFVGRSLAKYIEAGEEIGIINFSEEHEICKYPKHVKKAFKKIEKARDKYIIVCTGHQGESKAILSRILRDEFEFKLREDDHVIFSCTVIPNEQQIENREKLEAEIKQKGGRMFKDVHASGHGAREDIREMINLVQPEQIIPCHGDNSFAVKLTTLLEEMEFSLDCFHIMNDGKRIQII